MVEAVQIDSRQSLLEPMHEGEAGVGVQRISLTPCFRGDRFNGEPDGWRLTLIYASPVPTEFYRCAVIGHEIFPYGGVLLTLRAHDEGGLPSSGTIKDEKKSKFRY